MYTDLSRFGFSYFKLKPKTKKETQIWMSVFSCFENWKTKLRVWKVSFDFHFKIEMKIEKMVNSGFSPNIKFSSLTPKLNVQYQFILLENKFWNYWFLIFIICFQMIFYPRRKMLFNFCFKDEIKYRIFNDLNLKALNIKKNFLKLNFCFISDSSLQLLPKIYLIEIAA